MGDWDTYGGGQTLAYGKVTGGDEVPLKVDTNGVLSVASTDTGSQTLIGAVTETAPATDTASSGLNGRLQRIAQRLTSLIGLLPGTLGQKAMAASLAVTVASDQSAVASQIERKTLDTNFVFANLTVSASIDKRDYVMVEIGPLPADVNTMNLTILSGAASATNPKFRDSDGTYKVLTVLSSVVTGERYILQAEVAAIHDISIQISGAAITANIPVQFTA